MSFFFPVSLHTKIIFLQSVSQVKKDIAINRVDDKFIDITWEYYQIHLYYKGKFEL